QAESFAQIPIGKLDPAPERLIIKLMCIEVIKERQDPGKARRMLRDLVRQPGDRGQLAVRPQLPLDRVGIGAPHRLGSLGHCEWSWIKLSRLPLHGPGRTLERLKYLCPKPIDRRSRIR